MTTTETLRPEQQVTITITGQIAGRGNGWLTLTTGTTDITVDEYATEVTICGGERIYDIAEVTITGATVTQAFAGTPVHVVYGDETGLVINVTDPNMTVR